MKLYMAGPFFNSGDHEFNEKLAALLRTSFDHEVFLPQESEDNLRAQEEKTPRAIFDSDVFGMDWAELMVADINGADPDSGTSWELGYMYAKGKPAILYRTDFRPACGDFGGCVVNLMLAVPAYRTLLLPSATPLKVAQELSLAIRGFQNGLP